MPSSGPGPQKEYKDIYKLTNSVIKLGAAGKAKTTSCVHMALNGVQIAFIARSHLVLVITLRVRQGWNSIPNP